MSLKKKIAFSFFISASITAIFLIFEYISFIEIRKEIRFLEITDTIRSKSLQLRRHEKNFFLYGSIKGDKESEAVHKYIGELNDILKNNLTIGKRDKLSSLQNSINEYSNRFNKIESTLKDLTIELEKTKDSRINTRNLQFYSLIELTFLERPSQAADFLEKVFLLHRGHRLVSELRVLDSEITALRKNGEDILIFSKELDKSARENVESVIYRSQIIMLVFFPIFIIVGFLTLFYVISNVVMRLRLLTDIVEKTGRDALHHMVIQPKKWSSNDEVGTLIQKFNYMEEQLDQREKELLQSKKLAAIGTLASGVAHELNNPLNNIYTTAQRLIKKTGEECPSFVKKGLNDIFDQTMRVKRIVGDLLEFSSGREPQFKETELNNLITGAYRHIANSIDVKNINFMLDSDSKGIMIYADPEQMEQVFINLFTNAVDVMSGKGDLMVKVTTDDAAVKIKVSDTGTGMSRETIEKIFEPFFTTKDRGTGLGLAIVFNIIQKHNGNISVESEEGKGTTFIITLTLPKGNI